jgi:hypothetical protein
MRASPAWPFMFLLCACGVSTQEAQRQYIVPAPPDSVFTQVVRVLTEFRYTIETVDRPAGFVRGHYRTDCILSCKDWALTVTLLPDPTGTRITLQPENRGDRGTVRQGRITTDHQARIDSIRVRLRLS